MPTLSPSPDNPASSDGPPASPNRQGARPRLDDNVNESGYGSGVYRRLLAGDSSTALPIVRVPGGRPQKTSDLVRVRLLVAIPVLMVLLLVLLGGSVFQIVDYYYGENPKTIPPDTFIAFARIYLIVMAGFVALAALVGTYLAWSITRPVRELISVSTRVAGGDFSMRMPTGRRRDEMGMLGTSFNNMVDSLNTFISSRNRLILESFSGGLITADIGGIITAINSSAERMLDLHAAEVVGRGVRDVMVEAGAERVASYVEQALWKSEPVVARIVELPPQGQRPLRELAVTCTPMRDAAGGVFGLIVNLRDRAEMLRFYEQMNRADRLATLGTFAAGLAHEVRNPLGSIKGVAQLLGEDVRDMPRAAEYARVIVKEVNRLDRLVREVQEFSQPAATPKRMTDLSDLARDTVALARNHPQPDGSPQVEILENYAALPPTVVSREKLTQALLNVVLNALQATPEDNRVEISTEMIEGDSLPLRIRVLNTGSTISPEIRARIFEPFYTTKEGGTGLGLSIAYQVARYHGGDLDVESSEDQVTFTFRLPHITRLADSPEG